MTGRRRTRLRATLGAALAAGAALIALAGGCSETGSLAPRAEPAGIPAKLTPAPPENHRFPPSGSRR